MRISNKIAVVTVLVGVLPTFLMSASKVYIEKTDKHEIGIVMGEAIAASSSVNQKYNVVLGFGSETTLDARKSYKSKDGKTTTRYTQKFMNIPVLEEEVIIASKANSYAQKVFGSALYGISDDIKSTKVKLNRSEALTIAKKVFSKQFVKQAKSVNTNLYSKESSTLKIWQNKKGIATLVYDVQFMYMGATPTIPHFYIDANTGVVLKSFDNLMHADATGPGGNTKTGQYEFGTDLGPLDVTSDGTHCELNNVNVLTVDLNHGTDASLPSISPYSFLCPENTYKTINGAYSPLNDAHYFGGVVFNMYNDWFATAPLSFQLVMQVHYGTSYENAFWDGSRMTFGDGASTFYPLVDLNVVSHEVSHGFTQQNSNLVYANQSGGLNEAFSDMAGEAAEFYMKGTTDWYVGAEIMKNSVGLRSMSNPPSIAPSIDHQDNYYDGMDVHYSSGVYNKAFYLLAMTTGWDTKKAFEVYTKANQLYWTSGTDWNSAGVGVLNAASDLGYNLTNVCTSLNAVGIYPAVASCPSGPVIPSSYTLLDVSGTWDVNSPDANNRPGSYAHYSSFTLLEGTEVTIDLESATDTYLFLLDNAGTVIESNDDGGAGLNSKIVRTLAAGTYRVESTTYSGSASGDFTLRVVGDGTDPRSKMVPIITYLLAY